MELSPPHHPPTRWLWLGLLWTGVGLFDATQTVVVMHSQGMSRNWPQLYLTVSLSWLPWALAAGGMLDSRERIAFQQTETARLSEQLSQARLDALRRQIEPHFLFNTLNAITGLVREGRNEAAVRMIAGLSDLIRRVLEDSGTQHVTLGEEMEFLEKYLDIQRVRFGERLNVCVDVPEALHTARVPSLILQPMVENAIKHGIARRARAGTVRIGATQTDGILTMRVYNDGPGLPADWDRNPAGIGIPNVRTRLQSLYGNACELRIRNCGDGVEALLSVPFEEFA